MGFLRRGTKRNSEELPEFRRLWLVEHELERWFEAHPRYRLTQTMKRYLISEYDLAESDILNASKRVHRRLRL